MSYLFSVIIPIYNCEEYLEECVDSVLGQTIGSEKIEIILVNDGSTDNSAEICKEYEKKYNNILYIEQKNQGVSAARNNGLKHASGELINFIDSDDKWDKNAFKQAYKQIKAHPEVNFFSCQVQFFEARDGNHPLNYKYVKNKVVDIMEDIPYPQLFSHSAFYRKHAVQEFEFPTNVKYGEDVKFNADFLMEHKKFMVMSEPVYYYRRRRSEDSAVQISAKSKKGFFERYDKVYNYIFNKSKEKFGYVLPYFQYLVLEDLQWYIKKETHNVMRNCMDKFKKSYLSLLSEIDDDIVLSLKKVSIAKKHYCLKLKHNEYEDVTLDKEGNLRLGGTCKYSLHTKNILRIQTIDVGENTRICGVIKYPLDRKYFEIFYSVNDEMKKIPTTPSDMVFWGFDEPLYHHDNFDITIPPNSTVKFYIKVKEYDKPVKLRPYYEDLSHLHNKKPLKYVVGKTMVYNFKGNLYVNKYRITPRRTLRLIKALPFKDTLIRLLYRLLNIFFRKEIWLISDRRDIAGDNGEAFFEYVSKHKEINSYFVLDKDSQDFDRIKKIGKVVDAGSFKHRMLFLLASKNISSQADLFAINPLENRENYRDLAKSDFIFLQHGITKDNLSEWLNKRNKNIKLFITSAKPEYASIKEYGYGYDKEVVLTGMPRFDKLEDKSEKIIAIMPTWRSKLESKLVEGKRGYSTKLKGSEYYNFYNNLINDERLKDFAEKNGYRVIFVVHPGHAPNVDDFESSFAEITTNVNYREIFSKASLLITDYSSVAFDFAYLRKPIIYTQFDKEKFFSSHTYTEGYFSYENDGFGPVVYNYEDTVKTIMEYNEITDEYKNRIDNFFEFNDKKNCERTFNAIRAMS